MSDTEIDVQVPDLDADESARRLADGTAGTQPRGGSDPRKSDARPGDRRSDADDDDEYAGPAKKRINKLTAQFRGAQEAADRERAAAEQLRSELYQERQRSRQATEAGHSYAAKSFEAQQRAARDKLTAAVRDGDAEGQAEALEQIAEIKAEQAAMRANAPSRDDSRAEQQTAQRPAVSPKAQAWVDDNPWFKQDAVKQRKALAVHAELVEEGYTADSRAYYAQLTERTRDLAGDDDDDEAPPPKRSSSQQGAGVTRTTGPGPRASDTKVRLSAEEVAAAQDMGITPTAYAIEKRRLEAAGAFDKPARRR